MYWSRFTYNTIYYRYNWDRKVCIVSSHSWHQNKFVDLLYVSKNTKASVLKCLYLKKQLLQPLWSKFSSKAHFNFMHLAFVNGSNKRDFYVMRKEAKNVCLLTGTIFLNVCLVCVKYFLLSLWQMMVVFVTVCHGCHSWLWRCIVCYLMLSDIS